MSSRASDCEYFGDEQDCEAALEPGENRQVSQPPGVKETMMFPSGLKNVCACAHVRACIGLVTP